MKTKGIFVIWYVHILFLINNLTDPSTINTLSQQDIIEGGALSVTCHVTPGNPSSTTVYWTKEDNQGFRQNGATLQLPYIQRNSSVTYRCTAENMYSNGENGSDSQSMVVNVLCQFFYYCFSNHKSCKIQ